MLFFLISGFVIMYSMELASDRSFSAYFSRRFFRIYPIFLLSLAVGYACSGEVNVDYRTLAGNAFLLQDFSLVKPGVLFDPFCGNIPLWSLSYEWWFYLMFFPIYRYLSKDKQIIVVTTISIVSIIMYNLVPFQPFLFPAYFPLWWAGAEIARAMRSGLPIPYRRILISLGIVAFAFAVFAGLDHLRSGLWSVGHHPFLELRHVAAIIGMVVLLFICRRFPALAVERLVAPCAVVAPISYGVYALHYPLVIGAARLGLPIAVVLPAIIVVVIATAWFAEFPYQRSVVAIWRRFR